VPKLITTDTQTDAIVDLDLDSLKVEIMRL